MATKKKVARKKTSASRAKGKATKAAAKRAPARKAAPRSPRGALRLSEASPSLTADDLGKSEAFYRDVLGFTVTQRWEHEGVLRGLELAAGDVSFMMSQDDWQKGRDRRKGEGFRIYCSTRQDVDALAARMKSRGAVLDQEPITEMWGRFFSLTDPTGFKITIVNESKRK